jgi:hypothetical protein
MGYTNVRDYEGGKQDWVAAGFPVEEVQASAPGQSAPAAGGAPSSNDESASTNASTNPQEDVA